MEDDLPPKSAPYVKLDKTRKSTWASTTYALPYDIPRDNLAPCISWTPISHARFMIRYAADSDYVWLTIERKFFLSVVRSFASQTVSMICIFFCIFTLLLVIISTNLQFVAKSSNKIECPPRYTILFFCKFWNRQEAACSAFNGLLHLLFLSLLTGLCHELLLPHLFGQFWI